MDSNHDVTFHIAGSSTKKPLVLPGNFINHSAKSGLNPLVDAAAYLFSTLNKLKQTRTYPQIDQLQKDLIQEITLFQETAKNLGYNPEYILVSRFVLCATVDDIILSTPWGLQGSWDNHRLLTAFDLDPAAEERFFMIAERLMQEPHLYTDAMELIYLCLNLGFKGRSSTYNSTQLEQITDTLYRHIRAQRGHFNKTLSPFPVRAVTPPRVKTTTTKQQPFWRILFISLGIIAAIFAGFSFMLSNIAHQTYQELTNIGSTANYGQNNS